MDTKTAAPHTYDVIVIGAGISGINTAHFLQTSCPKLSFTVLEGRKELGGTWSLFKYPGIRSDSDLHTFGFSWERWNQSNVIAEGDAIVRYLRDTAKKHHIDEKIQFERMVDRLSWSSSQSQWTIDVTHHGAKSQYRAKYVVMGTGYYDYQQPLEARIPGLESFKGQTVHPQFWPEDLNYTDKNVIIIGSGATAVTLLPNLVDKAKSVTQVQRSPGYFLILPDDDPIDTGLRKWLPNFLSTRLIRWKYIILGMFFYQFCRALPERAKRVLNAGVKKALPPGLSTDPNFKPRYEPWDQRMCITPGGDYFKAYHSGKAFIKTDEIRAVTEDGMILKNSGEELKADIIITATGLKMNIGGGAEIYVDGKQVDIPDKFLWKGSMLQDIPNLWYVIGYANASWTLAADASAALATRMINHIEDNGLKSVTPQVNDREQKELEKVQTPLLPLKSTYVNSAMNRRIIPRCAKTGNWKPRTNYIVDMWGAKYGDISSGLAYH